MNILVLGVGHSGTTIVTRMLHALGWDIGDADQEFCESVKVRKVNNEFLWSEHEMFNYSKAKAALPSHTNPWVIKDPRFTVTLPYWERVFKSSSEGLPLLVHVKKDVDALKESYERRVNLDFHQAGSGYGNNMWNTEYRLADIIPLAQENFESWDGPKIEIRYEDLVTAVSLFKLPKE